MTLANTQTIFSATYIKILLTDEARRGEYISRILNFSNIFIFTFYISYTCVECGKHVRIEVVIMRGSALGVWGIHKSQTKQIYSFKRKVTTL